MAVKLNDGTSMPTPAFGFWNIPAEQCALALEGAIDAGYKCLDFAAIYGNEAAIGPTLSKIFKSGKAKREDLYIVSKLWATDWHQVDKACAKTLSDLQLDYLDMYLVHTAVGVEKGVLDTKRRKVRPRIANYEMWANMEELVKAGKTKSIGVSNWSCLQLADAFSYAKIPPAVNQLEIHPTFSSANLAQWCLSVDIAVMGYCTLGSGKMADMTLDVVKKASERLKATPPQVLMKWSTQKGYIPITKSVTPARIKSNKELAFELNEEEMKALDGCDGGMPMKVCDHSGEFGLPLYD